MSAPLRFDVLTIFPRMFDALLEEGIVAKAAGNGLLEIEVRDLREYATDKHNSTDDEAYGGGAGMVMLAEPVFRAIDAIRALPSREGERPWVIELSPQGRPFDQAKAVELCGRGWVVLLCGRYEGFDHRVRESVVDEEISMGDFVVTGGELPAMMVIDAVSRMADGVVGKRNSVEADSFYEGLLDYPHYTRPAEVRGMKVPEVLISGHFERIRRWRKEQSLIATLRKRPDLLLSARLDDEARRMLAEIEKAERRGDDGTPLPEDRK
ncbi:MAG: tRNA (guanosine(37)-N1)-methyltransferase TrmD [Thermoanaerobaculia bacterium]